MRDPIAEFEIVEGTWLFDKVQQKKVLPFQLKDSLRYECVKQKGESYTDGMIDALDAELAVIEALPQGGCALRGDKIEKLFAKNPRKSVDIYTVIDERILLIECKYKAYPETKIVSSSAVFNDEIVIKFENAKSFLSTQSGKEISKEFIVLFNCESVEQVKSMFLRLKLEDDSGRLYSEYRILDTKMFQSQYFSCFR